MEKLFIIDASQYLYRAYFAIHQMTNESGQSTNALFGFIRSVLKLIKDFQPTHMIAVFDGPNNSLPRRTIYPAYKAHRSEMPKDLVDQIKLAMQFCDCMGIAHLCVPEVEADDALGSIALWAAQQQALVYMCTCDKDAAQLVSESIFMLNTYKDNQISGIEQIQQQFGVLPHQMIDFLALTGDSSDNVPGVSGFGPKTAASLLQQFGTLEQILGRIEEVPGKKKQEILQQERNNAILSRHLVTIKTDVDFPHNTNFFQLKSTNFSDLRQLYSQMNFNTLLREISHDKFNAKDEFNNDSSNALTQLNTSYHLIDDEEGLEKLVSQLQKHAEICLSTLADDEHPIKGTLAGIGFGVKVGEGWYVPLNGKLGAELVSRILSPLFSNNAISFYGHDVKSDYHALARHNITLANIGFDTLIASYLLNAHRRKHSLDELSLETFGKVKIVLQDLLGKGKKQRKLIEMPPDEVYEYCCEDIDYTMRIKELLKAQLAQRKMEELFYQIELPLILVLARMEERGIFVDLNYLEEISTHLQHALVIISENIYQMAGEKFNLNSPQQLSYILFDKLNIPHPKSGSGSFSTSADILEMLEHHYPIAQQMLQYRSLEKLRSTYVDALPKEVDSRTQRIHCQFNQSGTATGRLACHNPNLQNIPIRSEIGRQIRQAFVPQKNGWSYLAADYSQIELRLLAHLSEDTALMQAFKLNEDIHAFTAAQIFGVSVSEVSREQRMQAKTVNFGIMYGQQAFGLSQELGIDVRTANIFIERYFQRYGKVKEYIEWQKSAAHTTGKVRTTYGRERLLPELANKNKTIRAASERLAVNSPIQGTQADLIKLAMVAIDKELQQNNWQAYMILQIHDELIFEAPDEEINDLAKLVRTIMQGVMVLKVPLVVDIHIGKNWKEC